MSISSRRFWVWVLPQAVGALMACSLAAAADSRPEIPVVAVVASSLATPGAAVTTLPQVTVVPDVEIRSQIVGTAASGWPINKVTMTLQVDYADLDLATRRGADELHRRIVSGSYQACNYLSAYFVGGEYNSLNLPGYPGYEFTNQNCVQDAIQPAMAEANTVIDAAR